MKVRFLRAFTIICVVLVVGGSFSLSAVVADSEAQSDKQYGHTQAPTTYGKEQRKSARAIKLRNKGKLKKSAKLERQSFAARQKGERELARALESRNQGDFKSFLKHLRRSIRLGNDIATSVLDATAATILGDPLDPLPQGERDTNQALLQKDFYIIPKDGGEGSALTAASTKENKRGKDLRSLNVDVVYNEAQLGDADYLRLLGELYLRGIGVKQNRSIAYAMFLHAEERGSGQASDELELLTPSLTPAEIARGDKRYDKWVGIIKKNQANKALAIN